MRGWPEQGKTRSSAYPVSEIRHSFCPQTNGTFVDRSTYINIAKTNVVVSHLLFLDNKEICHTFVQHIVDGLHCPALQ